jgi:phage gp16-like protein
MIRNRAHIEEERKMILEMIDASWEIAQKKGPHPLERGCSCIVCINKRKRLIGDGEKVWKYAL